MDESVDYFYECNSTELKDQYKWYVNSLFTVGMSLRELSIQAKMTKGLLSREYGDISRGSVKKIGQAEIDDIGAANKLLEQKSNSPENIEQLKEDQ